MADRKDLVRRFYKEVFENRNLDALDELITEDFIEHEQPPPGVTLKPGREGVREFTAAFLDAFKPFGVQVHEAYEDGNTVIMRVTFSGTHVGTFAGIPATGKSFHAEGIDIIRFDGDRAAEHWGQFDTAGMLMQLGVIPPME